MRAVICIFVLCSIVSCSKKVTYDRVASDADLTEIVSRSSVKKDVCDCLKTDFYIPNEELAVIQDPKTIYLVYHFPNSSNFKNNYTGKDADYYAKSLTSQANIKLRDNRQMRLPEGNNTPVYDIPWRYTQLKDENTTSGKAVYTFADDSLYYFVNKGKNRNNYSQKIIKKYRKHEDRAINVFAMTHHPDSIASKTYRPSKAGIALGTSVKISGVRQHELKKTWKIAPLYNHEIGHVVGLRHSWYKNDGCDDTPAHANCYSSKESGPCQGTQSNNMMDYNNSQLALTPCQIAIATKYLHNPKGKVRPLLKKDWCNYNPEKTLIIRDSIHLSRHADLKGDIIVKNGSVLQISCKVHMPKGGKIIVEPKGKLILNGCIIYNDCGTTWGGIELLYEGKTKAELIQKGDVSLENIASD